MRFFQLRHNPGSNDARLVCQGFPIRQQLLRLMAQYLVSKASRVSKHRTSHTSGARVPSSKLDFDICSSLICLRRPKPGMRMLTVPKHFICANAIGLAFAIVAIDSHLLLVGGKQR